MCKQMWRRVSVCLMRVFFSISHIFDNQRMSYAVAMNIDSTDTRFTRKSGGFLQVLFFT